MHGGTTNLMSAERQDANPFRLVTKAEAAELMSVSTRQLERLIAEGIVPVWKPSPGVVRVPWWAIVQSISRDCGVEVQLSARVPVELLRH